MKVVVHSAAIQDRDGAGFACGDLGALRLTQV
jgi:hypothetical protein